MRPCTVPFPGHVRVLAHISGIFEARAVSYTNKHATMRKLLVCCWLFSCYTLQAQEAADKKAVIGMVNQFFEALEKKDTVLYSSLVMRNAQIWVSRKLMDSLQTPMRSFAEDIQKLPQYKETLLERALSYQVNIHNNIAVVWAPYTFHLGKKLTHCGIDVFTLLKTTAGWKIVSTVYTVEPDGCAELQKTNGNLREN